MSQSKRKYVLSGPRIISLVRMLAEGQSYRAISRELGMSQENVSKLARRADIREQVAQWRQVIWDRASGAAGRELARSIKAMAEVRDDRESRQVDKLNAARAIVATAKELREMVDLEGRLAELEATREATDSPSVVGEDAEASRVEGDASDAGGSVAE